MQKQQEKKVLKYLKVNSMRLYSPNKCYNFFILENKEQLFSAYLTYIFFFHCLIAVFRKTK